MEVSFNGHKVQDNAQLSVADVQNPPVIKFAPSSSANPETYLFLVYSSTATQKYLYWATTSTEQLLPYQAPTNNGMYQILCIVLDNYPVQGNRYLALTRTNLNTFKVSDLGTVKYRFRFFISGLPGLPSVLKTNIAYQNLGLKETLSFCQVNPEICTDEYWRYAAKKFLTEDPRILASLTKDSTIRYLTDLNNDTINYYDAIKNLGFEKILPKFAIKDRRFTHFIKGFMIIAVDSKFPYLAKALIDSHPNEALVDKYALFIRSQQQDNVEIMRLLVNYLTEEELNNSIAESVRYSKSGETARILLETGLITDETLRNYFEQSAAVPIIKYLLEARPELRQELGNKYEMIGEYALQYRAPEGLILLKYLNTLSIPQVSVDNAIINYGDNPDLVEEILKKGVSQGVKNQALANARAMRYYTENILRRYGAV